MCVSVCTSLCVVHIEVRGNFSYLLLLLFTLLVLRKGLSLNLKLVSKLVSSRRQRQQASGIHPSTLSTAKLHTYTDAGVWCLTSRPHTCPTEPSLQPSKATLLTSVQPYCPPSAVFLQPSLFLHQCHANLQTQLLSPSVTCAQLGRPGPYLAYAGWSISIFAGRETIGQSGLAFLQVVRPQV